MVIFLSLLFLLYFGGKLQFRILIGDTCNNNCVLCSFLEHKVGKKSLQEIESEIQKVNSEIYDEIIIGGGEVLLNSEILEIIKLVRTYGFKASIETNARLISADLSKKFKSAKVFKYYIDFYSVQEKIHTFLVNNKDAFSETILGINNLIKTNQKIVIKLIITKHSLGFLANTIDYLNEIGIKEIQLFFPESVPEEYDLIEEYVPSIPDALPYINLCLKKMQEYNIKLIPRFTPFSLSHYKSNRIKKGRKSGAVVGHKLLFDNKNFESETPIISVIIPTYNRSRILKNTLVALFNQTLPKNKFEVLVIDDGSTDDSPEVIKSLNAPFRLRYILQDDLGYGPGRARNLGAEYANGEIILFLDADVISDPTNLEEHLKSHLLYEKKYNHDILVIGKRLDMHTNEKIFNTLTPETILNDFDKIKRIPARPDLREDFFKWCNDEPSTFKAPFVMVLTNNISVKRKYYLNSGMIDESFVFWSVEDQELGYRLQWLRFVLNPDAIGYHQHHPLVYSSKEGMIRSIKYNARIFYKKYLDPKLYEMYKPFLHYKKESIQINDATINESPFFKWLGKKPGKEKTYEEIINNLKLSKGEGVNEIIFEGGNPLLHPNIHEILKFSKSNFKFIGIDTELDSLESMKSCINLMTLGVNNFIVNLGGHQEFLHDFLVNKKGSFFKSIKALRNLSVLNQKVTVRIIISKLNYIHLKEIIKFLDEIGIKKVLFELALDTEENELLFDEVTFPISNLVYYYVLEAIKLAKELEMEIETDNIYSDFLGLNLNLYLRMYELFGKPIAISRFGLR